MKFLRLSDFEQIVDTGRTDGRTGCPDTNVVGYTRARPPFKVRRRTLTMSYVGSRCSCRDSGVQWM